MRTTTSGVLGWRSRLAVAIALVAAMLGASANLARAELVDGFQIDIPIDTVVFAPEGSITLLTAPVPVPAENFGERCLVTAHAENQISIHPNNDLLVESGSSQVVVPDVEAVPGGSVDAQGELILGENITVSLRMGPAERFSAGLIVEIDCTTFRVGRIIVVKQVTDGSDTTQQFGFTSSFSTEGFSLSDGGQHDSGDLAPGTYSVAETIPDGWTLQSATCDDGSTVDSIDLEAYETVTCTFVNHQTSEASASVIVTVNSTCEVVDGSGQGVVDIGVSVEGGATVTVRDSTSQVVGTATGDATLIVPEGATYTWEATANEGFVFPEGSATSGTITIESCSVPDEVAASIVVTVDTSCRVVDDEAEGLIDVTVSVDGGATVVIRDSDGSVVATVTDDATVVVDVERTYTWQATPSEGFEFPAGSVVSGTVFIDSCVDELPFTGPATELLLGTGSLLVLAGGAVLLSQRRREES